MKGRKAETTAKEERILAALGKVLPEMTEIQRERFIGAGEGMILMLDKQRREVKETAERVGGI